MALGNQYLYAYGKLGSVPSSTKSKIGVRKKSAPKVCSPKEPQ